MFILMLQTLLPGPLDRQLQRGNVWRIELMLGRDPRSSRHWSSPLEQWLNLHTENIIILELRSRSNSLF